MSGPMMAEQAPKPCPTIPARCVSTAPTAAVTSVTRCGQRAAYRGSSPPACGSRRTRNAARAQGIEPAHPSGAGPDRKDLRDLEALLRPAPDAMSRSRQRRRPSPSHRYCIQPRAHHEHPHGPSMKVAAAPIRAVVMSSNCRPRRGIAVQLQRSTPTRTQVSLLLIFLWTLRSWKAQVILLRKHRLGQRLPSAPTPPPGTSGAPAHHHRRTR